MVEDGVTYWYGKDQPHGADDPSPTVHLLQGYDEFFSGYTERRWLVGAAPEESRQHLHAIILDGGYVGSWQRMLSGRRMRVEAQLLRRLTRPERAALEDAVERYAAFVDVPTDLLLPA